MDASCSIKGSHDMNFIRTNISDIHNSMRQIDVDINIIPINIFSKKSNSTPPSIVQTDNITYGLEVLVQHISKLIFLKFPQQIVKFKLQIQSAQTYYNLQDQKKHSENMYTRKNTRTKM